VKWSGTTRGGGEGTEADRAPPMGTLVSAKRNAARSRVKWSGITRGDGGGEGTEADGAPPMGTLVSAKRNAARSRVKWSGITRGRGEGTEADGALIYVKIFKSLRKLCDRSLC
jgi:hypothetical protein